MMLSCAPPGAPIAPLYDCCCAPGSGGIDCGLPGIGGGALRGALGGCERFCGIAPVAIRGGGDIPSPLCMPPPRGGGGGAGSPPERAGGGGSPRPPPPPGIPPRIEGGGGIGGGGALGYPP